MCCIEDKRLDKTLAKLSHKYQRIKPYKLATQMISFVVFKVNLELLQLYFTSGFLFLFFCHFHFVLHIRSLYPTITISFAWSLLSTTQNQMNRKWLIW